MTDSTRCCADRLAEVRELSDRFLAVADEGAEACTRDECLVVFGVVRDCAWKIRAATRAWDDRRAVASEPASGGQEVEVKEGLT